MAGCYLVIPRASEPNTPPAYDVRMQSDRPSGWSPRDTGDSGHRRRGGRVLTALLAAAVLGGAGTAQAAFTMERCLAKKALAWGKLRTCAGAQNAKQLQGKTSDVATCQTTFQQKLAKIDAQATQAAVKCRYGVTRPGTVTDYDTGLMWEQKDPPHPFIPGGCFPIDLFEDHCVTNIYTWDQAHVFVSGLSVDGDTLVSLFRGYADWRLPTILELRGIVDMSAPGCNVDAACIDSIFGPTPPSHFRSANQHTVNPDAVWGMDFDDGDDELAPKVAATYVRAVRNAL